jgi:thiol:disulfide interchange protein
MTGTNNSQLATHNPQLTHMDPIRYMFGVPMVGIGTWFYLSASLYGYGVHSAANPLSGITLALFGAAAMFCGYGLLAPARIGKAVQLILTIVFFLGALHLLRTLAIFAIEYLHRTGPISKPGTQTFAILYGVL